MYVTSCMQSHDPSRGHSSSGSSRPLPPSMSRSSMSNGYQDDGPSGMSKLPKMHKPMSSSSSALSAQQASREGPRRRRTRCKRCEACQRSDCGECTFCQVLRYYLSVDTDSGQKFPLQFTFCFMPYPGHGQIWRAGPGQANVRHAPVPATNATRDSILCRVLSRWVGTTACHSCSKESS